jgi:thiamine biosynthesis lipoprotein
VDFDAFALDPNTETLIKSKLNAELNFSAIAKGYGVDALAVWLEENGVSNYFIEIGGEVRTSGENPAGRTWRVGIDRPEAGAGPTRPLQAVVPLSQAGMATSGNYRNFYVRDGRKYVHTINPATGYPEISTLLSTSVLARDCMTADAYATAFMVMGLDLAIRFVAASDELEAYFIYSNEKGDFVEYFSEGFPVKIEP